MKGIFDAYVLRPFDKKLISELVTRVNTCDYKVCAELFVHSIYNDHKLII